MFLTLNKNHLMLISIAGLVVGSAAVHAEKGVLEEVVVTAQRRAQNLQEVPVAVTAFSTSSIRDADIHSLDAISTRVPSVSFTPFSPGQSIISIRGISSGDDGAGVENSVALFLDNVYIGRGALMNFEMFDLERIEVLRGPQGTLYGKNAVGGAINIVSSKPSLERTAAALELDYGNYEQVNLRGLLSGAFSQSLAGKISFSTRRNEGYVKNIVLDKRQKDEDVRSIRGQLFYAGNSWEALFSADWLREREEDFARIPIRNGLFPIADDFRDAGGDRDHSLNPTDGFSERDINGISLKLSRSFDAGEFIAITALRDGETDWAMDVIGVPFAGGLAIVDAVEEDIDTFSQEFRWIGEIDEHINYVLGLFYLSEETERTESFYLQLTPGPIDLAVDVSTQENETESYAVFGNMDWQLTENLTLGLGARYTYEEKDMSSVGVAGGVGIIATTFQAQVDDSWNDFSPKISLNYQLNNETLIYGSVAKGFKSGGFQGSPGREVDATRSLDPEIATTYEVGLKTDLLDNSVRLNLAVFFTDYQDLQLVRFGPPIDDPTAGFGVFQTLNASDAEIKGAEVEWNWLLSENLQLSGSYSLNDSEYKDFIFIDQASNAVDLSGQELDRAPEHTYSFAIDYDKELTFAKIHFHLDYSYTDEQIALFDAPDIMPSYELLDARIQLRSKEGNWKFSLWGKNLTDEEYHLQSYSLSTGGVTHFGAPRTYGMTIGWSL